MMKAILLFYLCLWLLPLCLFGQVDETPWQELRVLDLSQSHDVGQLTNSHLLYVEQQGKAIGRAFSMEKQNVLVKIPGGRSFQKKIELGNIKSENGKLLTFGFNGLAMPLDEVYVAAKKAHISLGIPQERLDKWYAESKQKGRNANSFSNGTKGDFYPSVTIQIHSTMNPKYPWFIRLTMGWNITRKSKGKDEAWGWKNNPAAPDGYAHVSLDAPSGKIYDRKDAYRHLENPDNQKSSSRPRGDRLDEETNTSKPRKLSRTLNEDVMATDTVGKSIKSKWPIFVAIVVVLGGAYLWLKRASKKS